MILTIRGKNQKISDLREFTRLARIFSYISCNLTDVRVHARIYRARYDNSDRKVPIHVHV